MIRNLAQWLERADPVEENVGSIRLTNIDDVDSIVAMHARNS